MGLKGTEQLSSLYCSAGTVLGFLSNEKISSAVDTYTSAVDAAIQDGVNFIENTLDVYRFLSYKIIRLLALGECCITDLVRVESI